MKVFLMCVEKLYNANGLVMQLIIHITNKYLMQKAYNEYLHNLVLNVLGGNVVMCPKLRCGPSGVGPQITAARY
jgi:hypothetical protein